MTERAIAPRSRAIAVLLPLLVTATVGAQIAYPLAAGSIRARLTVAIVILFALASMTHVGSSRGARVAVIVLLVTAGIGFGVEVIGVHTGYPFGRYDYRPGLGPEVAGVPLVIALAWTMFAWPAAIVARRLVRSFAARVFVGAWALAAWDLFLDPQMVAAGRWRWRYPAPHLPGVDSVPLTNYAGWLAPSIVISLALQGILARSAIDDRWPIVLYLWTWGSSILALAAFLGQPGAALWGGLGMGLVAVPLIGSLVGRGPAPR